MSVPVEFLSESWTRHLLMISGCACLIYDYVLTFSSEVDHIWNAPRSAINVIFLLHRYGNLIGQSFIGLNELGFLSHGSTKFCTAFLYFQTLFTTLSPQLIHILVLLRVWAIYGCKRSVAVFLIFLYIVYMVVILSLGLSSLTGVDLAYIFVYLEETGVCVVFPPGKSGWPVFLVAMVQETFVFSMVVHSLYHIHKDSPQLRRSPLLRILIRDGALFYTVCMLNDATGIFCWLMFPNDPRSFISIGLTFPLVSIFGQRLVLNLREYGMRRYTRRDVSHEVDRQLAELRNLSFWRTDLSTNDTELDPIEGSRSRVTPAGEPQAVGTDEEHGPSGVEGGQI